MFGAAHSAEGTPAVLVDRYQLLERIGAGGMGVVWRCFDLDLEETVAIKFLHDEFAKDETLRGWFRREVKLARRVTHSNVARVYEFGRDGTRYFLTMEFVEGESLQALLDRGSVPLAQIPPLASSLCRGLAAAHAVGVVHGDIKPANIMLAPGRGAVLTDFGIARVLSEAHIREESSGGTPIYMAPELLLGGALTLQSDIYAVGVVLFEALTGKLPWAIDDMLLFLEEKCSGSAPDLRKIAPGLSPPWLQLITNCMHVDPLMRPESARALLDRLAAMPGPDSASVPALRPIEFGLVVDDTGTRSSASANGVLVDAATLVRVVVGAPAASRPASALLHGHARGANPVAASGLTVVARGDPPKQSVLALSSTLERVEAAILYREPSRAELAELYGLAESALSKYVDLGEAHLIMAGVLLTANEPITAAHSAAKAVRRAPSLTAAIALVGEMLCEIGEFRDAERHLDTALTLDRESIHAWLGRARLMAYQGRWDEFSAVVQGRLASLCFRTVHMLHLLLWPGARTQLDHLARLLDEDRGREPVPMLARAVMDFALERRPRRAIFEELVEAHPLVHNSRHTRHFALILCEMACILGEIDRGRSFLAIADDLVMYECYWLEHCPTIEPLRADITFVRLRQRVRARANSIADALSG